MSLRPRITAKRYDPKIEQELLEAWKREKLYRFDRRSPKPIYSIDTPPPYASGRWHVGAAVHYTQIDMAARYFRMKGYEVLFPMGIDRNGLPVEVEVEKMYGIRACTMPREEYLDICRKFLDEVEGQLLNLARRLGLSCDFENYYRTDSPEYRAVTQATFIELWKQGLIYEAERPTNWCPACGTTIADAEIEYVEEDAELYYIRWQVKEGGEIVIATTRPELMCSCALVIYNPQDERYAHLEGKHAIVPIYGNEVPIRAHPSAEPEFGTGIAMVCSFGDYADVRLFRELELRPVVAIDQAGRMNERAGSYASLTVREARRRIADDLRQMGLLAKVERIRHKIPVCWRSKDPIEFISMREYYLKQLDVIEDLRQLANEMEFYPPRSKQVLLDWIGSLASDWPISRRRYYGTEIPIWYCKKCGKAHLPEPGRYYRPWRDPAPFDRCECGSAEFVGETRTFDTWFDSSLSQLFALGYPRDKELFKRSFPCSLRPQGVDIVRTWLYYSILRTYRLLGRPAFKGVRLSGMGLDERGEAMHKSKGNVIYPEPYIERYGADSLRLWGCLEARLGSNYRFSEQRLAAAHNFLTKLWNLARFVSSFPEVEDGYELAKADEMILGVLNDCIRECDEGYRQLDFFVPAKAIWRLAWDVFASHYVECVKPRAYGTAGFGRSLQRGAWFVLQRCLQSILKLLAPICPFVTDALWRGLYGGSVHTQAFPEVVDEWETDAKLLLPSLMDFDSAIWKLKKSRGMSLAEELDVAYAPEALKPLEADLKAMHKIRELKFVPEWREKLTSE